MHVSRLRKALDGVGEGILLTRGHGYLLRVQPGQLDRDRFHGLIEEGRAALARDDPDGAAETLRAALMLWRGPPLADFAYDSFAQEEIARLEELHLAAAYGLDRPTVVRSFYSGRGQLADQFLPPVVVGHAKNVKRYSYNPARSRALLRQAGLKLPVKVDFWFPIDVSRPYMPDPKRNFGTFAASLERAGFEVVPHGVPWSPDYIQTFIGGKAQLYLAGWLADFQDPENYFDQLRRFLPQFGFRNPKLFALVARADAEPDL